MKVQPYDFCKPERIVGGDRLASDLERSLEGWLRGTCALGPKKWARHLPFPIELGFVSLETLPSLDALSRLPDTAIGFRISLQDEERCTLLVMPRPLLLVLVGGLLGDDGSTLPDDRDLTGVEESLCDYLIQDPLVATFQETWRGSTPLQFGTPRPEVNPRWTRLFRAEETVALISFSLKGPFGEQPWYWLVSEDDLSRLFGGTTKPQGAAVAVQQVLLRGQLEALVREFRLDVSVMLGSVQLPLSQLSKLQVGDLVVLDGRVNEPLPALIGGTPKLLGWPGRVGAQQAFQIESPTED